MSGCLPTGCLSVVAPSIASPHKISHASARSVNLPYSEKPQITPFKPKEERSLDDIEKDIRKSKAKQKVFIRIRAYAFGGLFVFSVISIAVSFLFPVPLVPLILGGIVLKAAIEIPCEWLKCHAINRGNTLEKEKYKKILEQLQERQTLLHQTQKGILEQLATLNGSLQGHFPKQFQMGAATLKNLKERYKKEQLDIKKDINNNIDKIEEISENFNKINNEMQANRIFRYSYITFSFAVKMILFLLIFSVPIIPLIGLPAFLVFESVKIGLHPGEGFSKMLEILHFDKKKHTCEEELNRKIDQFQTLMQAQIESTLCFMEDFRDLQEEQLDVLQYDPKKKLGLSGVKPLTPYEMQRCYDLKKDLSASFQKIRKQIQTQKEGCAEKEKTLQETQERVAPKVKEKETWGKVLEVIRYGGIIFALGLFAVIDIVLYLVTRGGHGQSFFMLLHHALEKKDLFENGARCTAGQVGLEGGLIFGSYGFHESANKHGKVLEEERKHRDAEGQRLLDTMNRECRRVSSLIDMFKVSFEKDIEENRNSRTFSLGDGHYYDRVVDDVMIRV